MYEILDYFNEDVVKLTNELNEMIKTSGIFETPVPEFREIEHVRRDLKLLKNLWDYVNVIESNLNEWKTTTWLKIDVESMDNECKKLIKELRRK